MRAGVASVLLATDAFEQLARMHAASLGTPSAPVVAVPHPLAGLPRAAVAERAVDAYRGLLTGER